MRRGDPPLSRLALIDAYDMPASVFPTSHPIGLFLQYRTSTIATETR